jgi:hypothetical protein
MWIEHQPVEFPLKNISQVIYKGPKCQRMQAKSTLHQSQAQTFRQKEASCQLLRQLGPLSSQDSRLDQAM